MRKIIYFINIILGIMCLTGCSLFQSNAYNDHEKCDKVIENLVMSLDSNDEATAKSFFAPMIYPMESFNDDLKALLNYYEGKPIHITGLVTTGDYSNYDYEKKHHSLEYVVETKNEVYRFTLDYVEKDSRTTDNIGITDLYVLKKSEDDYPEERYFGGLTSKDGIFVAYPHILPSESIKE